MAASSNLSSEGWPDAVSSHAAEEGFQMVIAVVDRAVQDWLVTLRDETEIVDDQGRLLGRFVPADASLDEMYREAATQFDPEEIRRRKDSGEPAYPLAEIMQRLNSSESI
jgi:hypothetical protein